MISEFLDEKGKWKCIECGACCRMVKDKLPEFDSGNGVCVNLKDNKCQIYDTRPEICRTKEADRTIFLAAACDMMRNQYAV